MVCISPTLVEHLFNMTTIERVSHHPSGGLGIKDKHYLNSIQAEELSVKKSLFFDRNPN
jgi:hypothetical protein